MAAKRKREVPPAELLPIATEGGVVNVVTEHGATVLADELARRIEELSDRLDMLEQNDGK